MSLFSNTSVLLGKELRTEFRSRELLTTTVVFILMVVVLFSFTFDPTPVESLLIASTEATAALFAENPALRWDWLAFLIAFDVIFLTAVWLFGEYLLEE